MGHRRLLDRARREETLALYFRIDQRLYKFEIHASDTLKDPDKKFRRLHRGVGYYLKNSIALAEEGLCGIGEILTAFLLTSEDNVTVGEALLRLEAGSSRPVTLALGPAATAPAPTTPTGVVPATKPRARRCVRRRTLRRLRPPSPERAG